MTGKIQTRLALLAALAALVAVVVPATLAFGSHDAGVSNPGPAEYVYLKLGVTDQFVFGTQAETITGKNNCTATTYSGPDIMNLSATGGSIGFVKDGFGVRSSGDGNGEPCGRAEAEDGEKITVSLGGALAGYLMTAVDVDLELKFNAKVLVEYFHTGSTTPVATDMFDPSDSSDDGPDSADLDNFRYFHRPVDIDNNQIYFDHVRFTPTSGAISLEGGADGTDNGELVSSNNWSQFEVVKGFEGVITCGDTETIAEDGILTSGVLTMHSEDKGDGTWLIESCDLKPFNADVTDNSLAFVPELEGTSARYTIEVTVENQAVTVEADGQITSLVAEYNPEGDLTFPAGTTEPLPACEGQPNLAIGTTAYNTFWTQTNVGLLPTGKSACFYSATVQPTSAGFGTELWGIYFEDDPGFNFK